MGWHNYLILKEQKLLVDIGNVSKETYEDELETFCKFFEDEVFENDYNLLEKNIMRLLKKT